MRALSVAGVCVLVLLACSDSTGPDFPSFHGTYTISGTILGLPSSGVVGSIRITNQQGDSVTVVQTFGFRSSTGGQYALFSEARTRAHLSERSRITWRVETAEGWCRFTGVLQGNEINGSWNHAGASGRFRAVR